MECVGRAAPGRGMKSKFFVGGFFVTSRPFVQRQELDKWQLKHRVVSMPSLLEFLGYA